MLLKRIEHETSGIIWIRHDVVLWCFTKFYCLPWQRSYICFADRKEICSVGFRNHSGQILLRSMRFNRPVLLPLGMMPSVFIRMIRLGKPWPISWFAISQPGWDREGFSDGKIHHENYANWVLQLWFSRQPSRLHQLSKYVPSSIVTELDGFPSVRCTLEELSTYLRSLVPDHEMQINLPCAPSGRNKGFAFVQLCEGLPLLVKSLWKSSIPTRKSTRPVKLQPANVNYA